MNDFDETELTEQDNCPLTNGDNGLIETRDSKGRFLPGNPGGPGNPQARNVATWRRALADSISADDIAQVAQKLMDAAKAGEPWAVKEFFDRCLGKPHVQIDFQADIDHIRKLTEAEEIEARRLAAMLLEQEANMRLLSGGEPSPTIPPGSCE